MDFGNERAAAMPHTSSHHGTDLSQLESFTVDGDQSFKRVRMVSLQRRLREGPSLDMRSPEGVCLSPSGSFFPSLMSFIQSFTPDLPRLEVIEIKGANSFGLVTSLVIQGASP